jgi:uncharacterized repeat protein (TIGR03847 family)
MNYEFSNPDTVMVGARGVPGQRLFLLQVRQGPRLLVIKMEKQQLGAISDWVTAAMESWGRPGHLPDAVALEAEYEPDVIGGDITLGLEPDGGRLSIEIESAQNDDTVTISVTREWACVLAIEIARLVAAGRPDCPLCGHPLEPGEHACPRTNGNRPPAR